VFLLSRHPLRWLHHKGNLHPLGYLVTAEGHGAEMTATFCNECKYFVENTLCISLVLGGGGGIDVSRIFYIHAVVH